ncbi:unnamed protein product [Gulo gulo]|uniref:Uncharacterized protein n=1 Tax=Gulo gulo TaxID=48420 RepID=A0A9X9LRR4_GULGU|nr:unnamed protein product [Gulo gulo]
MPVAFARTTPHQTGLAQGGEPDPPDRCLPPSDKWDGYVHLLPARAREGSRRWSRGGSGACLPSAPGPLPGIRIVGGGDDDAGPSALTRPRPGGCAERSETCTALPLSSDWRPRVLTQSPRAPPPLSPAPAREQARPAPPRHSRSRWRFQAPTAGATACAWNRGGAPVTLDQGGQPPPAESLRRRR